MWTERVDPTAALATIKMERIKSWRKIQNGNYIKKIGLKLQKKII